MQGSLFQQPAPNRLLPNLGFSALDFFRFLYLFSMRKRFFPAFSVFNSRKFARFAVPVLLSAITGVLSLKVEIASPPTGALDTRKKKAVFLNCP